MINHTYKYNVYYASILLNYLTVGGIGERKRKKN